MEYYVQCEFSRKAGLGVKHTKAWIPEKSKDGHPIRIGHHVQLLSLDGDFWEVVVIGEVRKSKEDVKEDERNNTDFQHSIK